MADPFTSSRRQEKFLRLSSSKVDDFGDYDTTTSEQLHSPASSFSSRVSRSPVPGTTSSVRPSGQRPCSRSPLPNGGRSPREPPRGPGPRQAPNETELKQKIQALEGTVAEYERQKFNVMGTFAEYRERVAERERKLEAEYSAKIITLSEEVLAAKKDFEERMKQFQALQEKFEREKENALEKLREEHQKEIQLLEQRCSEHQLLNLEQKYMYEIQRLDEERKSLKLEKEKLAEAFESKLWRAQTLYDTELSAAKSLYSNELDALKDHETALRDELLGRQEEFKDRLEELQLHLQQSKEELAKCEREVTELEQRLQEKEMEVHVISKQLEEARRETEEALQKLNGVENELQTTQQKYQEQEEQLLRKADLLNALESTKNKLESVIQDLQSELKSLKGKVVFLENERQNLESQSQTQQQLQNSQLQALEMVLDNLSKEKQMMKDHYDQQLEQERVTAEQREFNLKKDYTSKLNDFERHHKIFQEQLENRAAEQRDDLAKRLEAEFQRKQKTLQEENDRLQKDLMAAKKHLRSSLPLDAKDFKEEMDALEEKYKSTSLQLAEEKKENDSLRAELNKFKENVENQSKEKSVSEQPVVVCDFEKQHKEEIEKMRQCIEKSVRESMEKFPNSVSLKREEEYEKEIKALKAELASRNRVDRYNVSESRIHSITRPDQTVRNLQDTIDGLRIKLRQYEDGDGRRRGGIASAKIDAENKVLQQELAATKEELSRCIGLHAEKVNELLQKVDEQKGELDQLNGKEESLRAEIEKDIKDKYSQVAASTSAEATEELEKQRQKCEELQKELQQKESHFEAALEKLTDESAQKDEQLAELSTQLQSLKSDLTDIKTELDKKTQELQHIRSETHEYIRKREQQQNKSHKREVENLKNEHKAAIKEHEQAQEKIKKEMEELKEQLKQLDENGNRPAVKDDVSQEIENLQQQLRDNEAAVKRLEDEKQALKVALDAAREGHSQFSSPIGSMDSLRKRDSISSVGSAREAPGLCRRAVNMAIVNKWHCLVEQVKHEHKRGIGTMKSSSSSSIHKQRHFTHGAIEMSSGDVSEKSTASKHQHYHEGSQNDLNEADDQSQATDDDSRYGRTTQRTSNTLRLPDARRSAAKSPSRSPQPKLKPTAPGRRPAWRL